MRHQTILRIALVMLGISFLSPPASPSHPPLKERASLRVIPDELTLPSRWATVQLVVLAQSVTGSQKDVTKEAEFRPNDPKVVTVGEGGLVIPMGEGTTTIVVTYRGLEAKVRATVTGFSSGRLLHFAKDVLPVLSKAGCNKTGCHGSPKGKNGFKLSLFASEPEWDYLALAKMLFSRRVNRVEPERSLFLLKATGTIPHGGGRRIDPKSRDYELLLTWVKQGMPWGEEEGSEFVGIEIFPSEGIVGIGERRQLRVLAHYSDGTTRDVTRLTHFVTSTPAVATVTERGVVTLRDFGEAIIIAVYMGKVAVSRFIAPQPLPPEAERWFAHFRPQNRIDELVLKKLRKLGIPPSRRTNDAEFIRRVYLDVIGTLPKPEEVRRFLTDKDPHKREKLVDALLRRQEFVDFWTLKWCDLLRVKRGFPIRLWDKGMWAFYRYIRESIAENKPYDQFVRELLLSQGSGYRNGPVNFYRAVPQREPKTWAETVAMVFMGVRINCARCHNHPYESWTQNDHHGLAAFFAKVGIKNLPEWGEQIIFYDPKGVFRHTRTKEVVAPKFLGADRPVSLNGQDPRAVFVAWLTSPDNPYFAHNIVNRIWAWLMGRGIVHEPDDFRATNPPSNPELLAYLTQELIRNGYDLKHIFRLILTSRTYQTASEPNRWNRTPQALVHFARYPIRRLTAEQLLDALSQVCGHPEKFPGLPLGLRAIQLPDNQVRSFFLDLFGRPERAVACECERKQETAFQHALYLVSSDHLERKVRQGRYLRDLLGMGKGDEEIMEELWLAALARYPTGKEKKVVLEYVRRRGKDRLRAWQDILWAVLNTKEFLFNH